MWRQVALGFQEHTCGTMPSRRTQWDSNPQPLNTCVSRGAGSTTELSPTPQGAGSTTELSPTLISGN